jgi:CBS domain-containing protein
MSVGEVCTREFVTVRKDEQLSTAARLMLDEHVGMALVVDDRGASPVPIGVVTDRDIVRCLVRNGGSLEDVRVRDALTPEPLVLLEEDDVAQAIDRLRARGVRRAPVVDRHDVLIGVVSVDDLFAWLAGQLDHLARLVEAQPSLERR